MTLRIYLLGQFRLQHDDEQFELPSRPAQSLLAYLAINAGIPHRREKLAGLLWPDSSEENARSYLRQALWRIRKSLEENSFNWEDFLETDKINITFKTDCDHWLDTRELLRDTQELGADEASTILKHYQGELLPGFYDEWVSPERERFRATFHQKITHLMEELIEKQQWDRVFEWAEDWIRLSPVPEPAYRGLMRAYAAVGDQAMLTSTYERCKTALMADLGVDVSSETAALYDELIQQMQSPGRAPPIPRYEEPIAIPAFLDDPDFPPPEPAIFVAREDELQQLSAYLQDTLSRKGKVFFITGEAGSGKTALLNAFAQSALVQHPDLIIANGHCNAQTGIGDPYLPMREILGMLAGDFEARLEARMLTQEHAKRLWANLPAVIKALESIGPDLLDTFTPSDALLDRAKYYSEKEREWFQMLQVRLVHRTPSRSTLGTPQNDLFEQYSRVLGEVSRSAPMLLMLDDLQWADAGSLQLLFHIGREIEHYPILIVGAYRQEEVALGRQGERHPLETLVNEFQRMFGVRTINLGQSKQHEFIDALLDSEPNRLESSFREMLFQQTQGHPLFTIELLRAMQESGDLIHDKQGRWVEGSNLDWERLPARVEAVVAERIERLSPSEKTFLRSASVEGETFTAEVLSHVLGINKAELLNLLSTELDRSHRLIRAESIQRIGDQLVSRYQFRHAVFQKYLYNSLNDVETVHLHQDVGLTLEELYANQVDKSSMELNLARHFELAGLHDKAIDYYHQAGDRAVQLSGYVEGITHLNKALKLLQHQPETPRRDEKELALQLSIVMSWKYNWPSFEGEKTIERIRSLCAKKNLTSPLAQVFGELSIYYYIQANYEQSLEYAMEALELARQTDDPLLIAECHWHLGFLHFGLGDYSTALDYLNYVDAFYDPDQHHLPFINHCGVDAGLSAQSYRACCLWCLGYPDQAIEISHSTIALADDFGHPFTIADVLSYAGCLFNAVMRDTEALLKSSEALIKLSKEVSLSLSGWLGLGECFLGEALTSQDKFGEAISIIESGLAASQTKGVDLYKPLALHFLARAQLHTGEIETALKNVNEAFDIIDQTGERIWEIELYRHRALIMQARGNNTAAEEDLNKALEIARSKDAKSWELRVSIDLARLWLEEGKQEQANVLLNDCYSWFTEGFETPDLKEASALLTTLSIG